MAPPERARALISALRIAARKAFAAGYARARNDNAVPESVRAELRAGMQRGVLFESLQRRKDEIKPQRR